MVSLTEVHASNARIATELPARLVGVFVGGTSGIGETTLKQFAKHVKQPRAYFIGRSQEAADRITEELKKLNPEGEYIFIKGDSSLVKNVDEISAQIKAKEKAINLLFLTIGTLVMGKKTAEDLNLSAALCLYTRTRFILNLLPELHNAPSLRRVVTVFCGAKEGPIFLDDPQGWNVPTLKARGHGASMVTLALEAIAQKPEAAGISFVHDFPGLVKTQIGRDLSGVGGTLLKGLFIAIAPFVAVSNQESGERHLFVSTSARFAARGGEGVADGLVLEKGGKVARGTDGKEGSGVYSTVENQESAGAKVEHLLAGFRKEGLVEKVWGLIEEDFVRITGKASL